MWITERSFNQVYAVAKIYKKNPIVSYCLLSKKNGTVALEPMKRLIKELSPSSQIETLIEGQKFKTNEVIAVITGYYLNLVQIMPLVTLWAGRASSIVEIKAPNNHISINKLKANQGGLEDVLLQSYGAKICGYNIHTFNGAENPLLYLDNFIQLYKNTINNNLFNYKSFGYLHSDLFLLFDDIDSAINNYMNIFPNENLIIDIKTDLNLLDEILKKYAKELRGIIYDFQCYGTVQRIRKMISKSKNKHIKIITENTNFVPNTDGSMWGLPAATASVLDSHIFYIDKKRRDYIDNIDAKIKVFNRNKSLNKMEIIL